VLRVADAAGLEGATAPDRLAVEEYRDEPIGRELIQGPEGWAEIKRDLRLIPDARFPRAPLERLTERRGTGVAPALRVRL
jgi:hypothetical protein